MKTKKASTKRPPAAGKAAKQQAEFQASIVKQLGKIPSNGGTGK